MAAALPWITAGTALYGATQGGGDTTVTSTDPSTQARYDDLYNKAQGIAQQPFVPYTGGRVAGFNPDQLQGFDASRNMFNQSMSFNPRNQLNNLANMSAPSVNLPFGYSQPQQPSPIFQPMPITGGGGRPTPPPSFGGPGGGGPIFTSPRRGVTTDSEYGPITDTPLGFGGGGGINYGGPRPSLMLPPGQLPQAEKDFQNTSMEDRLQFLTDKGIEIPPNFLTAFPPRPPLRYDSVGMPLIDPGNRPIGDFSRRRPQPGEPGATPIAPTLPGPTPPLRYDSVGMPLRQPISGDQQLPPGFVAPDFNPTVTIPTISSGVTTDKRPITSIDRRFDRPPLRYDSVGMPLIDPGNRPIGDFSRRRPQPGEPGSTGPIQGPMPVPGPGGGTGLTGQITAPIMQQKSTVRPVERFGGANITQLANFGGANIDPIERFGAANISPIDLYSGASVNRGDVRDVRPQSLLDTNLGAYQNPFQSQVIDNTLGDLNRARQLQIQSDQDAAIGRGAFGGSRSALLESETNRNFAEQAAKTAGNLRAQGFDRATGLAGQDIGRQFDADRYMSDADRAIAMQNASFGQQAGLAKQGLLGDVSLNQARLNQQAGLAGMDAANRRALQQGQFQQQAGMADMDAFNRAVMQDAQFRQQAGMAGADAYNRAGSQQAQLDASRFAANQNASNQMNMGMFDAANRAAFMQPGLEMQNRGFQASLLGNQLSDQYRNLGLLSGIGSQQQGLQQAGMDAGYNEFLRAIGYGPQQLGLLSSAVFGMDPGRTTTTEQGLSGQIGSALDLYTGISGLFNQGS